MKCLSTTVVRLPLPLGAMFACSLAWQAQGQTPLPNDMFSNSIPIIGAVVTVTNAVGTVTSSVAALTLANVWITAQPQNASVAAGYKGSLSAAATGMVPVSCQWLWNGTPLANETKSTLELGPVTRGNSGTYSVMVMTSAGNWMTLSDTVRALVPPVLEPPQFVGANATSIVFQDSDGGLPFDVSRVAVQWRTNLPCGTDTNWQSLNSALLSTGGFLQATDTNSPFSGARYDRIVEQ